MYVPILIGNPHPVEARQFTPIGELFSGIDFYVACVIHEEKHVAQIALADALLPTNGADSFRYGWSWGEFPFCNHWTKGPDLAWGDAGVDEDGNGIFDDARTLPPFEPGNHDDVDDVHLGRPGLFNRDFPLAWPLPGGDYAVLLAVEGYAVKAADDAMDNHKYSRKDWGKPGKNHKTLDTWDD